MRKGFLGLLGVVCLSCSGSGGAGGGASGGAGGLAGSGGTGGTGASGGSGGTGAIINTGGVSGSGPVEVVSSLELERVWYIASQGDNALIDFNQQPPKVTCGAPVGESDGFEGTGVFTNPSTGELYFYTDGTKGVSRHHQPAAGQRGRFGR